MTMLRILALGVLTAGLAAGPAPAAERAPALRLAPGGPAAVESVVDGDTVILAKPVFGRREVRLVGIQAPKLPLGRKNFKAWPLAPQAKRALARLVRGKKITLRFGGRRQDRHGRLLAHLYDERKRWIQGELLLQGMARVYSFPDNRARVAAMLKRERAARAARRGIWADSFYAIRLPEEASEHVGTFQIVRGRVLDAAKVRARVYLNFGKDWRSDFTVSLDARARRMFRKARLDPLTLQGKTIRVRGWLRRRNGPMIEATHPEQIEVIEEKGRHD